MGIIRQAFLSFLKNSALYVTILLELMIVMLGIHVYISGIENQKLLLQPYEKLLKNDGFSFSVDMRKYTDYDSVDEYYKRIDQTTAKLKNAEVFTFCTEFFKVNGSSVKVILYDDAVVSLKLPLKSGRWAKEKHTGVICADFAGLKTGQSFMVENMEITVSGVLTDLTYVPKLADWEEPMDASGFYEVYEAGQKGNVPFVILPLSCFSQEDAGFLEKFGQDSHLLLISYSQKCSQAEKAENEAALSALGYVTPLSEIYENSIDKQQRVMNYSQPLFVLGIIISVIGFVSNKLIRLKNFQNEMQLEILCGAKKSTIVGVCLWQDVIMLLVASLFAAFFLVLLKKYGIFFGLILQITGKNLLGAFVVIVFYLLLSFVMNILGVWRESCDRA